VGAFDEKKKSQKSRASVPLRPAAEAGLGITQLSEHRQSRIRTAVCRVEMSCFTNSYIWITLTNN
jgi:hypothetical protein